MAWWRSGVFLSRRRVGWNKCPRGQRIDTRVRQRSQGGGRTRPGAEFDTEPLTEDVRFELRYGAPTLDLEAFTYTMGSLRPDSPESSMFVARVRRALDHDRKSSVHLCPLPTHLLGVVREALGPSRQYSMQVHFSEFESGRDEMLRLAAGASHVFMNSAEAEGLYGLRRDVP